MQLSYIRKADTTGFFYIWIVGTSEASFASILDLQRTLFYDIKNFDYSEIANLSMSELYFLTISGPHEKKESNDTDNKSIARESFKSLKKLGLA